VTADVAPRPRSRRPTPAKPAGQGQWALGQREPLNANERVKRDDDGLAVRARILNRYAHTGFAGIDPADLRSRFRWWGLYTQRREGIPGGQTAVLEPAELDAEYFMLRVRIDGGRLTGAQLRAIADVATTYGRDVADVTDRQNIQLHWIRVQDVPQIWARLEGVGLTTAEACGDTPRVMLGCPLAGVAAGEILDATPDLLATVERFIGDPAFSNLPRKFKTAISGCPDQCAMHEINDLAFVGVRLEDGAVGYDLWVGGGLSTNPRLSERLGAFVRPEQVPEVWGAVTSAFRDYGYRRSRTRARLKFLLADWGPERFRSVLEKEYLSAPLPDGPPPPAPRSARRDHVGVIAQADGLFAVGAAPDAGRLSGTVLAAVADLAERYGNGEIRTTTSQQIVVLGVPGEDVETMVSGLAAADLQVRPSAFRRGTLACTGIEFCKLAIVETKARAAELTAEMERRLPDFDEPIGITVNGCPNSCARFQTADIGLKGSLVGDVEGFQVHLGGQLAGGDAAESGFGRKLRGLKVTGEDLPDYLERVLLAYLRDRGGGERFAAWARRAPEEALR
jgi:sulfite reductase (ferredoxin)